MAEIGRNDHILFAFRAICINNILNDVFKKSGTSSTVFFLTEQSYMTYKCENGQNDRHGFLVFNTSVT